MAAGNAITMASLLTPLEHGLEAIHVDPHIGVDLIITSLVLILVAYFGGRKFRATEMVEPSGKADFANFIELAVGGLYSFVKGILGEPTKSLFFLFGSLFFFILVNNLIGLVPLFNPPTDQLNTTIVLGLIVFIVTHFLGLKTHGAAYIKHFMGPLWWLAPLMLIIELISHLVRPLSLGLRLFGNMTGDHKVVAIFFGLAPLLVPLPVMAMGIFVSLVQAFVFLLLSVVYIQGALDHAH